MIVTNYTPEDLKKLAAPGDRRLERPLCPASRAPCCPGRRRPRDTAVPRGRVNAIRLTENVASGSPCPSPESVVTEVESCRAVANADFVRIIALATIETAARGDECFARA